MLLLRRQAAGCSALLLGAVLALPLVRGTIC
jgi:hypothetical protein